MLESPIWCMIVVVSVSFSCSNPAIFSNLSSAMLFNPFSLDQCQVMCMRMFIDETS